MDIDMANNLAGGLLDGIMRELREAEEKARAMLALAYPVGAHVDVALKEGQQVLSQGIVIAHPISLYGEVRVRLLTARGRVVTVPYRQITLRES